MMTNQMKVIAQVKVCDDQSDKSDCTGKCVMTNQMKAIARVKVCDDQSDESDCTGKLGFVLIGTSTSYRISVAPLLARRAVHART